MIHKVFFAGEDFFQVAAVSAVGDATFFLTDTFPKGTFLTKDIALTVSAAFVTWVFYDFYPYVKGIKVGIVAK